ncbi:MAG: pyruvate kinase [Eubacteriales bacterium]|nr:pyruvate kinase [Eubacteriales bacterium]
MRKTKIVCTIGPASDDPEILKALMLAGMNVARLNFSHGDHAEQRARVQRIRDAREELGLPVALLLDTKGPEVRTQSFLEGRATLVPGETVVIVSEEVLGTAERFSVTYSDLHKDLVPGNHILIDDGLIQLKVSEIVGDEVHAVVETGGEVSNHKSINLPEVELHLPALTEKDIEDLRFAAEEDFDFVAASFVRKASDVLELRKVLEDVGGQGIRLIAKIENREGVENFETITQIADGIMVARGDLGVEIPEHEVPSVQKKLIRACYKMGKPCITATQMLDSMIRNPRPTRAEVSDVANAVIDGTSAIMLSGETAIGKYPLQAVQMMDKIAVYTEAEFDYWGSFRAEDYDGSTIHTAADAVSHACCMTAMDLEAKAIVTVTHSGRTARMVSKYRPASPILAFTVTERSRRQLALSWGVEPYMIEEYTNTDELFDRAGERALEEGRVEIGDIIVVSGGTPVGISGTTNTLKVQNVGEMLCRGQTVFKGPPMSFSGEALVLSKEHPEIPDYASDFILVTESTKHEDLPLIRRAKGLIVEDENPNGHAVTAALALGIPIIYGAKMATRLIKADQQIVIDLDTGIIR